MIAWLIKLAVNLVFITMSIGVILVMLAILFCFLGAVVIFISDIMEEWTG